MTLKPGIKHVKKVYQKDNSQDGVQAILDDETEIPISSTAWNSASKIKKINEGIIFSCNGQDVFIPENLVNEINKII